MEICPYCQNQSVKQNEEQEYNCLYCGTIHKQHIEKQKMLT